MPKLPIFLLASVGLFFNQPARSATPPEFVELQTNLGTIAIQLDYAKAPLTANNFISYVKSGFYKGTLFHRVVKDFVIQGGGYSKLTPSASIALESKNGLSNLTGTIAMARKSDPDFNSATSQFFINVVDNTFLDYKSSTSPGYAVFGKVIHGMDVVNKIANLTTFNQFPFTDSSAVVFVDKTYPSALYDVNTAKTRITLSGAGNVVSTPSGITCGLKCVLSQTAGEPLKLTATAKPGSVFSGWRGDCQGSNRTITLDTLKGNHNCTAVFTPAATVAQ